MEILLEILLSISFLFAGIILMQKKDILHPTVLSAIFISLPLLFAMQRLSGLQATNWNIYTYVLFYYAIFAFSYLPFIYTTLISPKHVNVRHNNNMKTYIKGLNNSLIKVMSLITILLYLIENMLLTGYFFPILSTASLTSIHLESVPIVSMITKGLIPILAVLNFAKFKVSGNNKFNLFISVLLIIVPLTRLSRFDIVLSILAVVFLLYDVIIKKRRFVILTTLLLIFFTLGAAYIGEYRLTHGYQYDVSYSDGIYYKYNPGPFDVLAVLYGYFPLSFENVNNFTEANTNFNDLQWGKIFLRPLLAGLLKFDNIFGDSYPLSDFLYKYSNYVSPFATVHTASIEFALDFGYIFAILPMVLVSIMIIVIYQKGNENGAFRIAYYVISQGIVFYSFFNLFFEPKMIYQLSLLLFFTIFSIKVKTNREIKGS